MAKRRRKSRGKKIFLIILTVPIVLVLTIVGVGTKLYLDLPHSIEKTYESMERTQGERTKPTDLDKQESFSILLMGIDTGDLSRVNQGRSDTVIVATVSPENKQTMIVSIPRDTYVDIVGHGTKDRTSHAYALGGAAMAMDTVQKYVDIPVDHCISINMKGLKELIDAVDDIEVNNGLTFSQDSYDFTIDKIALNGDQALSYSRMRYKDPNGDYDRQGRQGKIIEGVAKKVLSLNGVNNYQSVLDTLESNTRTDMSFDEIRKIALDYREAFGTIKRDQLQGEGFMQDNISYQKVNDQELDHVKKKLENQVNLENKQESGEKVGETISLKEVFGTLRKHLVTIIISVFAGLAISGIVTFFILTPKYSLQAQLTVALPRSDTANVNDVNTNLQMINTYKDMIVSDLVLSEIKGRLGIEGNIKIAAEQIRDTISVDQSQNSQMFSIQAISTNAVTAQQIAGTTSQVFQENAEGVMNVDKISIISGAVANTTPASPNNRLNLVTGLILGMMVGVGLALLFELLDRIVKDEKYVTGTLGFPILGTVPEMSAEELNVGIRRKGPAPARPKATNDKTAPSRGSRSGVQEEEKWHGHRDKKRHKLMQSV